MVTEQPEGHADDRPQTAAPESAVPARRDPAATPSPSAQSRTPANRSKPQPARSGHRRPLAALVVMGTFATTSAGAVLFLWFAWLLARQPAPLRGDSGWWDWLGHVDGTELFDAARTTATVLAIVGLGGAALVAYRRQDTAELAHQVSIEGQRIANAQHELDSDKYQLDRDQHELDVVRRSDDRERELRARFTTVAEQLGSENFAVRHAGAYALAALADDWHQVGKDAERQVCVDLLCAQLRQPRLTEGVPGVATRVSDEAAKDLEVRKTIVALIKAHRPITQPPRNDWISCTLDLSRADLSEMSFVGTDLNSANLDDANLSFTDFYKANLVNAQMARVDISGAKFIEANLTNARLYSSRTLYSDESDVWGRRASFEQANLTRAWFTNATLLNADFEGANLSSAILNSAKMEEANFSGAFLVRVKTFDAKLGKADFTDADVRGANFSRAEVFEAKWDGAKYDSNTRWRNGELPSGVRFVEDDELDDPETS